MSRPALARSVPSVAVASRSARADVAVLAVVVAILVALTGVPVEAQPTRPLPETTPTATGTGGAVATVDGPATEVGIDILRRGGNAVDAAVATAAVLGLTQPFSAGIGGGGFMLIYLADEQRVISVDSRETAPQAYHPEVFLEDGTPIPFDERVTSGLGVGVPGTVRGWEAALERYGTMDLRRLLQPAITLATRGFVVDETFRSQIVDNAARFADFTSTRELYLPGGQPPAVGTIFRNRDLAETYRMIARDGAETFYQGEIADAIVDAVQDPPTVPGTTRTVRPGLMERSDLVDYEARVRQPTHSDYRGLDVYGMGPPSSGGSTVGEALNILEGYDLGALPREEALHAYLEASRFAFADRGAYLGDPEHTDVPLEGLLSDSFAAERRAEIGPEAATSPVPPGDPYPHQDDPSFPQRPGATLTADGISSTTHLTVSDADGNVVSYTFTIEQTGGSGIVVPGHGFLLNNELTDFDPVPPHPNAPEAGKRPRSSMAPTIVLDDGEPVVALGSPGGSTIITTVLQILVNHLDFGMTLPEAIAAPRASQRNTTTTTAEAEFVADVGDDLAARGHAFTTTGEIGAATGIAFHDDGTTTAAAEPVRRGDGAAAVVHPDD